MLISNDSSGDSSSQAIVRDLRTCGRTRSLPIVYWTTESEQVAEANSEPTDPYLAVVLKAADIDDLIETIRELLQLTLQASV